MTYNQRWERNNYKVQCDICGHTRKRSQCQKTWDGFLACRPDISRGCWYPKHPNDMPPPVIREPKPARDARPISTNYNFQWTSNRWETMITMKWEDAYDPYSHKWEMFT